MYRIEPMFEPEPLVQGLHKPVRELNLNITQWFEPLSRTCPQILEDCSLDYNYPIALLTEHKTLSTF